MALTLAKIEAVRFGDFEVVPKFGQEQRKRVQNLRITEENLDEARDVIAACFGDDSEKVKDFMKNNLFLMDYVKLQTYLTQGQFGLDSLEKRMNRYMDKEVDKAVEKAAQKADGKENV